MAALDQSKSKLRHYGKPSPVRGNNALLRSRLVSAHGLKVTPAFKEVMLRARDEDFPDPDEFDQ
jgi:hypothetical protein